MKYDLATMTDAELDQLDDLITADINEPVVYFDPQYQEDDAEPQPIPTTPLELEALCRELWYAVLASNVMQNTHTKNDATGIYFDCKTTHYYDVAIELKAQTYLSESDAIDYAEDTMPSVSDIEAYIASISIQ